MALLEAEAAKLSLDMMRVGVIEEIITSDEMFKLLPFKTVTGKAYVYNRENALSGGTFVDETDTITEGAATFAQKTAKLKRLIGDVDVDDFLQEQYANVNDQAAVQIAKKSKAIGRQFAEKVIIGDETGTPKEFDGLLKLITVAQTVTAGTNGAALSFGFLDNLIDLNKVNGQKCFIMNSRTIRSYAALCRALGGVTPEQVNLPGVNGSMTGYRGIPVLKNDWIPTNQTEGGSGATCTSIFLATLDEEEGICGLASVNNMGIEVKTVGPVQNKDATRYRVRWYAGLVQHSTLALTMCKGVNN